MFLQIFHKPTVEWERRRRKIKLLLHSTNLYKNFTQILQSGEIQTAGKLIEIYGREKAKTFLHDPNRYEQFAVGLDYLNCSLSEPNAELLYRRSKSGWKQEWIHLALDLKLLERADTKFSKVSAAQENGKHIREGYEGFKELFADDVEDYNREGLAKFYPTHPQAEVLIKGSLPLKFIEKIMVAEENTALEVERLCSQYHHSINIEIAPHLFVWPERLLNKLRIRN